MTSIVRMALGCLIVLCCGHGQSTNPREALKSIEAYRADQQKAGADAATINAGVTARAEEAIKGVDAQKIAPTDAGAWASLFRYAHRNKEARDLYREFLTTNPQASVRLYSQFSILSVSNEMGDADGMIDAAKDIRPSTFAEAANLVYAAIYQFSDTVAKKKGSSAAISFLDSFESKVPFKTPDELAKDLLADDHRNGSYKPAAEKGAEQSAYHKKAVDSVNSVYMSVATKKAQILAAEHKVADANRAFDEAQKKMVPDAAWSGSLLTTRARTILPGNTVPKISILRTVGNFKGLGELRGKVVVLDCFGSFCKPCEAEYAELKGLYATLKPKGLEVVGVTRFFGTFGLEKDVKPSDEFGKVQNYLKPFQLPWPILYLSKASTDELGVYEIPQIVLIDRKGLVTRIESGFTPDSFKATRKAIEDLVGN